MKKETNQTEEYLYRRIRKVCRKYRRATAPKKRDVIRLLAYAEGYFRRRKNIIGILFVRKNQLRCILHHAEKSWCLKSVYFVNDRIERLINRARCKGLIKPSFSKLFIKAKIAVVKLHIRKKEYTIAQFYVDEGFCEITRCKEEFPTYHKTDLYEADLFHLQRIIEDSIAA